MNEEDQSSKESTQAAEGVPPVPIPEPLGTLPASQPATEKQLDKVEREMNAFERSTLTWTRATFGILLVTCLFIGFQWYEMRSGSADTHTLAEQAKIQAGKMSDMSDAAEKIRQAAENMVIQDQRIADNAQKAMDASNRQSKTVLDANIAASRLDQRAWVGVLGTTSVDFSESAAWKVTFIFFNGGRTPAQNVRSSGMFTTSNTPLRGPSPDQVKQLLFTPAQSIAPQGRYNENMGWSSPAEISTSSQMEGVKTLISQYPLIKDRKLFLYYYGMIQYDDIFGNPHQTQFCIYLANPDTKEIGICDGFNDLN